MEGNSIRKKVCQYFINRNCRYGPKGDGCRNEHPKICRYFAQNGDRRGGCKKGKNCKFFHPSLCWQAMGGHECNRKTCHFLHPYGLKPHPKNGNNNDVEQRGVRNENVVASPPSRIQKSYAQTAGDSSPRNRFSGPANNTNISHRDNQQGRDNPSDFMDSFLEIRQQLVTQSETMKLMQQQLMQLMRDRQGPGRQLQHLQNTCHPRW